MRDGDFEKQLHERLELAEREKRDAIALAEANVTNARKKTAAAKDTEIQALKAQLDEGEVARKLAVTEALFTTFSGLVSCQFEDNMSKSEAQTRSEGDSYDQ